MSKATTILVLGGGAAVAAIAVAMGMSSKAKAQEAGLPKPAVKPKVAVKKLQPKVAAKKPATPPKPSNTAEVVSKIPDHAVTVTSTPVTPPGPVKRTAKRAAEDLYAYATRLTREGHGADLGTTEQPSQYVHDAQLDMGKLTVDGAYGPKTMARGKELLGKPFPKRDSVLALPPPNPVHTTVAPKPAPPTPVHKVVAKAAPKPVAPKPVVKNSPPPTAAYQAAVALDAYLSAGRTARDYIADRQWDLGLDSDGLPGPQTKKTVEQQLGHAVTWPAVSASGPVPGGATPTDAALRLTAYVKSFGGSHADRIQAYQREMGVDPAGVVGPKTKARVKELTGVQL